MIQPGCHRLCIRVWMSRTTSVHPHSAVLSYGHRSFSKIGRMLDMGGMPSAKNDTSLIRTVNASKNSKLQAVAFDFDLLVRSLDQKQLQPHQDMASKLTTTTSSSKLSPVQPDLGMVQEVASLLNVKVDTGTNQKLVDTDRTVVPNHSDTATTPHHHDIRAKYANKLKHGLAGLELAKSQVNEALARGDAPGHLAARKLAQEQPPTQSSQARWLAMTGVGKLLSYLTHRSIRIALLSKSINPQMAELAKQLKNDVVIDVLMDGPRRQEAESTQQSVTSMETLVKQLLEELDKDAQATMLVSDRDDFLKAARDLGMITCQYRPGKNARRGNVTCSYTATSIDDIQGVINEINGISFNAVLNR